VNKKYRVTLTEEERTMLQTLIAAGTAPARTLTHARILLKADQGPAGPAWPDAIIADALDVSSPSVARVRERLVEQGLTAALQRQRPSGQRQRRLDGVQEAHLVALACGTPPEGQQRWSLRLLADRLIELEVVDTVSHETVRQVLKKTNSSRG
jgi:transposase